MFRKLWTRLIPGYEAKQSELRDASQRVSLTIDKYKDLSRELQAEIERNRFAKYLIYEKEHA